MNLIYSRLKKRYRRFNAHSHTFEDFLVFCRRENIKVFLVDYKPKINGYYCIKQRKGYVEKFIVINSNLSEFEKLFVAFHELAHCLLHVPMNDRDYFYCSLDKKNHERQDKEADAIALIWLIPKDLLFELAQTPFDELHPFTQELLLKRKKIFDDFGV